MRDVYVVGVGMTRFAKHLDRSIKDLSREAVESSLADAGLVKKHIEAAWFSNSMWGYFTDQHCIRGQVVLRELGIDGIPICNVENACASASTAFHQAWMGVACGLYDCTMALGAEKLYSEDREKTFKSFSWGLDVENMDRQFEQLAGIASGLDLDIPDAGGGGGRGVSRSAFMDVYSGWAKWHMATYGTTQRQLAVIASKNHFHSSMNSKAQYQQEMSVDEILDGRPVSWPLTVPMCAPVGDGSASAILCSKEFLSKLQSPRPVKVLASILGSGTGRDFSDEENDIGTRLSRQAYEVAGVGPEDIDFAEVHDATAFGELHQTEALGFCKPGEGGAFAESGATRLGGRIPVNVSGGLESRGHPIGASGLGQMNELVVQLRHEAGDRQVEGCRIGMAENGGGFLGYEEAAMCIHILKKV
jgi:acetyl-CoA acetyltransferase